MAFTVLPDGSVRTDTVEEAVELALEISRRKSEAGANLIEPKGPSPWKPNRPNGHGCIERSGRFGWRWSVMTAGKRHVGPTYGSRAEAEAELGKFIETGVMPPKPPRAPYRCRLCNQDGHTSRRCPLNPEKGARRRQHKMDVVVKGKVGPSGLPIWACSACGVKSCSGNEEGFLFLEPGATEWKSEPRWCPGQSVEIQTPAAPASPAASAASAAPAAPAASAASAAPPAEMEIKRPAPAARPAKKPAAPAAPAVPPVEALKVRRKRGPTPPRKVEAIDLSVDRPISVEAGDAFTVVEDFVDEETGQRWLAAEHWVAISPTGETNEGYDEWTMSHGPRRQRAHPQLHPFLRLAS
jgi:hypothetical protein